MAFTTWLARRRRDNEVSLTPVLPVAATARNFTSRLDVLNFDTPDQGVTLRVEFSQDGGQSFPHFVEGTWLGGPITWRSGVREVGRDIPPGTTHTRAELRVNGTVSVGLLHEART